MLNIEGITELLDKFKIPIALGLVGVILIIGGVLLSSPKKQEFPKESLVATQTVSVDVSGAVQNPGVYKLGGEARVEDAIKAAGGLGETANGEYISKTLNLAQKLSDGIKIYIPFVGEKITNQPNSGVVVGTNTSAGVNINTGTQAELEALPGIGPVTASKIISGRPYGKVNDLLDQKIVSKSVFEKIKGLLAL